MTRSMTGFGKAQGIVGNKKIVVETKSVNSKGLDLSVKTPSIYREKEIEIRKMVGAAALRGKVECSIYYDIIEVEGGSTINTELVLSYINSLQQLHKDANLNTDESLLEIAMRMPDVFKTERSELTDEEWQGVSDLIQESIEGLNEFRESEGKKLEEDFKDRVEAILNFLAQVEPYESERIDTIKTRINQSFEEVSSNVQVDQNRFEQEIIFYLEKFDINEEKVRLKSHCDYFKETLSSQESNGKKLGFISQEMGREINTLGSKANHAAIQKLVVQMKDELEKIKEQVLNVL